MDDIPNVVEIVAVWIGRDEQGVGAAVLFGSGGSKHYCSRADGTWRAVSLEVGEGEEYAFDPQPELRYDPLEVAQGIMERDDIPPGDPAMN